MDEEQVTLGHGGGGELSTRLLQELIFPAFHDVQPRDGALVKGPGGEQLVITTDSFVVDPPFFRGGNIGKLSVNGTVNDLAMMGACPAFLTCGFVLEEGVPFSELTVICATMARTAEEAGVQIVTGDTKVVRRGEGGGIFINTAGVGFPAIAAFRPCPEAVRPGDYILINGDLGRHGMAVLTQRLKVTFESELASDSVSLWPQVAALLAADIKPRVMRDVTRGGLAGIVSELATGQHVDYQLFEEVIPIDPRVRRACELWGYDPLDLACEGRFILVVSSEEVEGALAVLSQFAGDYGPVVIGQIKQGSGRANLRTTTDGIRPVRPFSGELLPRIC